MVLKCERKHQRQGNPPYSDFFSILMRILERTRIGEDEEVGIGMLICVLVSGSCSHTMKICCDTVLSEGSGEC